MQEKHILFLASIGSCPFKAASLKPLSIFCCSSESKSKKAHSHSGGSSSSVRSAICRHYIPFYDILSKTLSKYSPLSWDKLLILHLEWHIRIISCGSEAPPISVSLSETVHPGVSHAVPPAFLKQGVGSAK